MSYKNIVRQKKVLQEKIEKINEEIGKKREEIERRKREIEEKIEEKEEKKREIEEKIEEINNELSQRKADVLALKKFRKDNDIKKAEMARKVGVNISAITLFEGGKIQNQKIREALKNKELLNEIIKIAKVRAKAIAEIERKAKERAEAKQEQNI